MQKLVLFLETDLRTLEVVRWLADYLKSLPSKCAALPWVRATNAVFRLAKPIAITVVAMDIALLTAAWFTPGPGHFRIDPGQHGIAPSAYSPWYRFTDRVQHHSYAMLTFDDGPAGGGLDEKFLAVLSRHHAHAIFFLVCKNINERTLPVLGEMERSGNMIGNHSFDHLHVPSLSYADTWHQVDACSSRIADITGHRPKYFRPPFGHSSAYADQAVQAAGMKSVFWNVNSKDYMYRDPNKIFELSTQSPGDMSIFLMHERAGTAEALDKILTDLEHRGFTFVLPDDQNATGV
jgi:peptidoglycan/xylan/chitin deacetylase (PgdA/CDA1 family)